LHAQVTLYGRTLRTVARYQYEAAFEISRERLRHDPEAMTRRRASIEHPFGTLKYSLMILWRRFSGNN
jgi:hypothetical protein